MNRPMNRLPLPARIACRLIPAADREEMVGDLVEAHARRRAAASGVGAWFATSIEGFGSAFAARHASVASRLRGARAPSWLEWRLALRLARRQPGLSMVCVFALATGIGLASTGFTVMYAIAFGALPFPDGDRFVDLDVRRLPENYATVLSVDEYAALTDRATTLSAIGAYRVATENLVDGENPIVPVRTAHVAPAVFGHTGVAPVVGRSLVADDATGPPVAVIGEALWSARFGRDRGVLGSRVNVGTRTVTIVGVMPDGYAFPGEAELWVPLDEGTLGGVGGVPAPGVEFYGIVAPGVTLVDAEAQINAIVEAASEKDGTGPTRVGLGPWTLADVSDGTGYVLAAVVAGLVLVLLVAAANVANLVLARTLARRPELAVRTALGADRGRIVAQLFVEILVLGAGAAVLGLVGCRWALSWFAATTEDLPFWLDLTTNLPVVAFVTVLVCVSSAVAGVLPALRATRGDVAAAMRTAGGTGPGPDFGRLSFAMVLAQVALSVSLLSGAGVVAGSLSGYAASYADLPGDEVLTARIYFEPPWLSGVGRVVSEDWQLDSIASRHARIRVAIEALPGVANQSVTTTLPRVQADLRSLEIEPAPGDDPVVVSAPVTSLGPGFFRTLSVGLLQGREFSGLEHAEGEAPEVIVNEPFATAHFRGRNAVGRRVRFVRPDGAAAGPDPWMTIIGVVPDLGMSPGDPAHAGGVYTRLRRSNYFHVLLRPDAGDPLDLIGPLRAAVASAGADIRVDDVMMLERAGWAERALLGAVSTSLALMGAVALLLSLMGLYAIVAFGVTLRRREIGVRVALGASRRSVVSMVLRRSTTQLLLGAVTGAALAFGLLEATQVMPIRIASAPLWLVPGIAALMVGCGVLACLIPTRVALAVRPGEALRSE